MNTFGKAAIAILLFVVTIGYFATRKIDPTGEPRLVPNLGSNTVGARLAAHLVAPATPPPTDPATCLSLVSYKETINEDATVISGNVKNACDRRYRYIQISFDLFDTYGRVVGKAFANQGGLDAGEIWSFNAHGSVSAAGLRFDGITAF